MEKMNKTDTAEEPYWWSVTPWDMQELCRQLAGATITRAETVDHPLTSAITLYMQRADGRRVALEVGTDERQAVEADNPFYMNVAELPA